MSENNIPQISWMKMSSKWSIILNKFKKTKKDSKPKRLNLKKTKTIKHIQRAILM